MAHALNVQLNFIINLWAPNRVWTTRFSDQIPNWRCTLWFKEISAVFTLLYMLAV